MTIPKESLKNIQLLIFDLDGTLVDSQKDLALSVNALRANRGLKSLDDSTIASYVGRGVTVLVTRALGENASTEEIEDAVRWFKAYYRDHMLDHTEPYPGVREALDRLRGRKLAVLTNKPVRFSRDMLARLNISRHFAFIYGDGSFAQKKPDPVGVTKLMADTGASCRETMIVGDSDTDILTGANAGVWTCGVTYGFGASSLESTPPDLVISDLRELPALLDGRPT